MKFQSQARGLLFLCLSSMLLIGLLATVFVTVRAAKPSYEGQTQFLIGFYDVSWAGTEERKYKTLETVGEAGFTLMAPALELDDEAYLERAAELGIKVIVEPNDDNGTRNQRQVWANRPEILGWIVTDDFNSGEGMAISDIVRLHDELKEDTPLHASYMSGGIRNLNPYFGSTDMIGVQLYSIPNDPLYMTDLFLQDVMIGRGSSTTRVVANVQTYAAPGERAPDAMEIRSMTYQALINDVDAILYYTFFDETWDLGDHPQLWADIAPIAGEIHALNDVIMQGTLTRLPSSIEGLVMAYWTYGDKYYLVINNATYEDIDDVRIPLPMRGHITNMFPTRSAGFAFDENTLVGRIAAKDVHVYIIEPV